MSNVITHPRFDRPAVHQPCPRRRKGTIIFPKSYSSRYRRQRHQLREPSNGEIRHMLKRELERETQAPVNKVMRHAPQEDARDADVLPLYIPNTGWRSYALVRALLQLGIGMEFDIKRQAIVLRAADERGPAA